MFQNLDTTKITAYLFLPQKHLSPTSLKSLLLTSSLAVYRPRLHLSTCVTVPSGIHTVDKTRQRPDIESTSGNRPICSIIIIINTTHNFLEMLLLVTARLSTHTKPTANTAPSTCALYNSARHPVFALKCICLVVSLVPAYRCHEFTL
jgi:hypothetical protein